MLVRFRPATSSIPPESHNAEAIVSVYLVGQRHFPGYTSTKRKRVSDLRRNTLAGALCLYIRRIRTKVALSDYLIAARNQ